MSKDYYFYLSYVNQFFLKVPFKYNFKKNWEIYVKNRQQIF